MRALKKGNLIHIAVTGAVTCVFCALATVAMAGPVTLSALPAPSMFFTPNYFGSTGNFPSNGNDYVKAGSSTVLDMQGLVGRGPHGGYDTASNKCGVCHSAHNAIVAVNSSGSVNNQFLTRGTTGCEYCHVGSGLLYSNDTVYSNVGNDPANLGADNSGHELSDVARPVPASDKTMTLSCVSCHTIHGTANAWMPTDFYGDTRTDGMDTAQYGYMLLRANPGDNTDPVPTTTKTPAGQPTPDPAVDPVVNQFALSDWCASCHNKAVVPEATTPAPGNFTALVSEDKVAHDASKQLAEGIASPHTTTAQGVGMGALQCYTCHRGGDLSPVVTATDIDAVTGLRTTLTSDLKYDPPTSDDQNCSLCHYGTADFASDPQRLAGLSNWPHSSKGDVALLGAWTVVFDADTGQATGAQATPVTWTTKQELVCGRCHPVDKSASDVLYMAFATSPHSTGHTFLWGSTETTGALDNTYSPGY